MTEFNFNVEVEETSWLVDGIIPLGQLGIFLAQAGVGKSLLLEDLGVHMVHEETFCGFNTVFGDVLLIDQDTPDTTITKRLVKFGKAMEGTKKYKLYIESMKGYSLSDGTIFNVINDYPECRLIIIDSLHSVCGRLNVNYVSDMNILAKLKSLCLNNNKTILINHHISEKNPFTVEELMTGNPHVFAMGSSAIIQQADTYYVVAASAENGYTNKLFLRPIAKRASLRSTPLILQFVKPVKGGEKLVFESDYIVDFDEVQLDCLTLFKEQPNDRTVKEVFEHLGQQHGINQVRKALHDLNRKGMLILSRHRSNLFKYKLP